MGAENNSTYQGSGRVWNSLGHVRIFGSPAYALIPSQKRKKLDRHSIKLLLVGYQGNRNYRLFNPETKSITICRHVVFNEEDDLSHTDKSIDQPLNILLDANSESEVKEETTFDCSCDADSQVQNNSSAHEQQYQSSNDDSIIDNDPPLSSRDASSTEEISDDQDPNSTARKSSRKKTVPVKFQDYILNFSEALSVQVDNCPKTYSEAMQCGWQDAINDELQALQTNKTWELVDRPVGKKVIDSKWVFTEK